MYTLRQGKNCLENCHTVKPALRLPPSATATPDLAWLSPKIPYLGEGFALETASSGLKYPILEKEMADFKP
jgi:hypothetical protein